MVLKQAAQSEARLPNPSPFVPGRWEFREGGLSGTIRLLANRLKRHPSIEGEQQGFEKSRPPPPAQLQGGDRVTLCLGSGTAECGASAEDGRGRSAPCRGIRKASFEPPSH